MEISNNIILAGSSGKVIKDTDVKNAMEDALQT